MAVRMMSEMLSEVLSVGREVGAVPPVVVGRPDVPYDVEPDDDQVLVADSEVFMVDEGAEIVPDVVPDVFVDVTAVVVVVVSQIFPSQHCCPLDIHLPPHTFSLRQQVLLSFHLL